MVGLNARFEPALKVARPGIQSMALSLMLITPEMPCFAA